MSQDHGLKVALVTGGGSGIGKAAAAALAKAGFAVVLAGRRAEPIESAAEEIVLAGGQAIAVATDVGDPQSVAALFEKIRAAFGRLDFLFNNAGMNAPGVPIDEITYEQWSAVVAANLTGVFLCTQQAFKLMKEQKPRGGRIVNNGSIAAHAPRPNLAPYTATKHAVTGLTKSTALDGRAFDIACGQIDIGNAATAMAAKQAKGVIQANGTVAVEPLMDTADVARAIVYMASLPLESNVLFMTVMATKMPFVGRG
jgi:NAD(P)-dependent dehydrogenase (short-subunit alcohol dehydrogenase family)